MIRHFPQYPERGNMLRRIILPLALLCSCAGLLAAQAATPQPQQEQPKPSAPAKNDYSKGETWLCRPGRQDACVVDLTTTIVSADGKLKRETWTANPKAPIDCF